MAGWGQTGQVRDSESLERPMNGELPIMRSFNEEFDHPWGARELGSFLVGVGGHPTARNFDHSHV